MSIKKKVVKKLSQNYCTNIISLYNFENDTLLVGANLSLQLCSVNEILLITSDCIEVLPQH